MTAAEAIETSSLFRGLAGTHPRVEVWPDQDFVEGGYSYSWIVAKDERAVRILAYVRWKAGDFQKRTYDENGDDVWVSAG
jgi:hypothetical protein